jgi:transcription initiation factor TFIIIB Brf1 subunit/transcription initiation factor TFIIB
MESSSLPPKNDLLAAAIVSMACRMEGYARSLQEISQASGLDMDIISKQSTISLQLYIFSIIQFYLK